MFLYFFLFLFFVVKLLVDIDHHSAMVALDLQNPNKNVGFSRERRGDYPKMHIEDLIHIYGVSETSRVVWGHTGIFAVNSSCFYISARMEY